MSTKEGFIQVSGGKIWYEIVGEKKELPLIVLHGGPGYPHDYLEPLKELADEREVIFYDQLGCGNSERPDDISLWTVNRFVIELQEIIKTLILERYHILGHSWGAALATTFALTKPQGLQSLILSDSYISTPQWEKDMERLIKLLPEDYQKALKESAMDSEEFKKASQEFYHRFIYRHEPLPEIFKQANEKFNFKIYNYMWGPKEYLVIGTLKNFDLTKRFSEITVPVLILCGRYDEATPESSEIFKNLFPHAQLKVFEDSAHYPFWNERVRYMDDVRNFLEQAE